MTTVAPTSTSEQQEFRAILRRFLESESSVTEVRRLIELPSGFNTAMWKLMAEQLELQGIAVPEAYGGSGLGAAELILVLEELGRSLACTPYFSTVVLAAPVLLYSGDSAAAQRLLPQIASGDLTATVALTENSKRWDEEGVALTAVPVDDGFVLSGEKTLVMDGVDADLVIVVGRTRAGVSLFLVDGTAAGFGRHALQTLDLTRRYARLTFRNVPAVLLGIDGNGWDVMSRVLDFAGIALAAEQLGGAQYCLESSAHYACTRFQFGRPIGSFQAIKHKCADMKLQVERAKSAVHLGVTAADGPGADMHLAASVAQACCSDVFTDVAQQTIQIHGGIGFTWEHSAHLYFRRAQASAQLLGSASYHREQLLHELGV
jgi:alkylation response protein AidB-like acyl-CoA dehydrogenase